jgi:tungstate transport system permease protein
VRQDTGEENLRSPLETSKGDLPLAIGLGLFLIGLIILVNAAAWGVRRVGELRMG